MSLMHLVFCSLAIHIVTEGKIIQGILGQSVSFSWTYNVTFYDAILILHNESIFCVILPGSNNCGPLKETDRFRVFADNTTPDKVKLTVHFLNFSTTDIGLYRVVRQRNARELDVSVHLETKGIHHYTSMATVQEETSQGIHLYTSMATMQEETSQGIHLYTSMATMQEETSQGIHLYTSMATMQEETSQGIHLYTSMATMQEETSQGIHLYTSMATMQEETSQGIHLYTSMATMQEETSQGIHLYTSMATMQEETSQEINRHSTAALTPDTDTEALPSKRQLLNIVFGMGGIIAVTFFACLLHKIRLCVRVNKVSSCNTLNDSSKDEVDDSLKEENLPANYWTIVSNERGEMSTAIETDLERHMEPSLIVHATISTQNESEDLLSGYTIKLNDELDGYLSPIHSRPVELDGYIHPVHSEPVELDEYIHPFHSEPVEFDAYIHPIHTDPVEFDSCNHPLHTDFDNAVCLAENE